MRFPAPSFAFLASLTLFFADTANAVGDEPLQSLCPSFVRTLANDYLASQEIEASNADSIVDCYCMGFFKGYTGGVEYSPMRSDDTKIFGKSLVSKIAAGNQGVRAGKAHREGFPNSTDQVFAGFGYTKVKLRGTWQLGSGSSCFRTNEILIDTHCILLIAGREARKLVAWTPTPIPERHRENVKRFPLLKKIFGKQADVTVMGYLSGPGKFGGVTPNKYQLFATSVVPRKQDSDDG